MLSATQSWWGLVVDACLGLNYHASVNIHAKETNYELDNDIVDGLMHPEI